MEHLFSRDETRRQKKPEIDGTELYKRLLREILKAQNEQERALERAYEEEVKTLREHKGNFRGNRKAETPAATALEAIKLPAESLDKLRDSGTHLIDNIFKIKVRHDDLNFAERLFLQGFEVLEDYATKVPEKVEDTLTKAFENGSRKSDGLPSSPSRIPEQPTSPEPSAPPEPKIEAPNTNPAAHPSDPVQDLVDETKVEFKLDELDRDAEQQEE